MYYQVVYNFALARRVHWHVTRVYFLSLYRTKYFGMAILTLPSEILIEIFAGVPRITDLLTVCHVFHNTIKTSIRLNYWIELERAGMIDNPHCELSTTTKLEMLRERERSWGHFDWKFITNNLKVPSTSSLLYTVTPSAVILGLKQGFRTVGFQSIKLPCTVGEVAPTAWKTVNVGEDVLAFGTSIEEHDLLAYVTRRYTFIYPNSSFDIISFCSWTTNEVPSRQQLSLVLRHHSDQLKPHEDSSIPRIPICTCNPYQYTRVKSVEIVGENVATTVMVSDDEDTITWLYIFDWKTGIEKFVSPVSHVLGKQYIIFSFLTLSLTEHLRESSFLARRHSYLPNKGVLS